MKKLIMMTAIAFALCACSKKGESVEPTTANDDFHVQFLFEVDGIKVYRFYDGRNVYFTNAKGECRYTDTETRVIGNGKTTTTHITHHDVETLCNAEE